MSEPSREAGSERVHASGLGFTYPSGRVGIEPVTLEVEAGEVVVVLGPNGSGKSTLLRLLATDLRPTGGALRLLGRPAVPPSPALRRRVGFAPHQPVHFEALTGRENGGFYLALSGATDRAGERFVGLLNGFRLAEALDVPVSQYSWGMARKLLLAQVFAMEPDLVVLDEPTLGLDPDAVDCLGRAVTAAARRGAALVLATNEVHRAPEWATRILFLHRGRVVEDASAEALRRRLPRGSWIRIGFRGEPTGSGAFPEPKGLPGLETLRLEAGVLEARSAEPGRDLPVLLEVMAGAGLQVQEVRVKDPDLGDLYRTLTGEELSDPHEQRADPHGQRADLHEQHADPGEQPANPGDGPAEHQPEVHG